ncbi:uncharacterized protein LOC118646828 [Monomorium pharaonis]|uniref:uncharacterized protein LOC118646828 n=1 Tax=Monomorium pharaonis TaxID=307658 RepID=UPI0017470E01|nr:uncharacterized protein LOC118646828 [Monomorium pharaonis]
MSKNGSCDFNRPTSPVHIIASGNQNATPKKKRKRDSPRSDLSPKDVSTHDKSLPLEYTHPTHFTPEAVKEVIIGNTDSEPTVNAKYYTEKKESNNNHIYDNILNIRRKGKNLISINFRSLEEANKFLDTEDLLPNDWVAYIPSFKVLRTGVIRDISPDISKEEFLEGLEWPDIYQYKLNIIKVERLKFLDRKNNNLLKPSSSMKITFESNLLPEYIYLYKVKHRILPFINKVRKCTICCRWGHSNKLCRGTPRCEKCGRDHELRDCNIDLLRCSNCGGDHGALDTICPSFLHFKLINYVMAYTNCSQFSARRLIKSKEITSTSQVAQIFKSSVYMDWFI